MACSPAGRQAQCLARFGESYRAYQAKTGMFVPRTLSLRLPRLLPASGPSRTVAAVVVFVAVMGLSVAAAFALRDYSLSQVTAIYHDDVAILSPARLTADELDVAYRTAMDDAAVEVALDAAKGTKQIVYVIPQNWYLPDLPVEAAPRSGGAPHGSADFDRSHYKVLFARARSHDPGATGPEIVKAAYGLDPIIVARVDIAARRVTAVETPPAHVRWGDIPTPTF
jgi:hypothetical protein